MGSELLGIGRSIHALIELFNAKLTQNMRGKDPLIQQDPDEYRSCFTADNTKLQQLINDEINGRKTAIQQQAQFDNFIKDKLATFMEAKQEMENQFIQNYQEAWMKNQMAGPAAAI